MPIYDYGCSACGHLIEVVHGIHDHGPRFCPECGAEGTMAKAFAPPTFHFKGSGWAKKDRSAASKPASKAKGEGTSSSEAAPSGSSGEAKASGGSSGGDGSPSTPATD